MNRSLILATASTLLQVMAAAAMGGLRWVLTEVILHKDSLGWPDLGLELGQNEPAALMLKKRFV